MSEGGRLVGAGPRVRLPTPAPGDGDRAVEPVRTCVGCRGRDRRSVLVRVVAVTEGERMFAVVDPTRSLPGRGAWLHHDVACLDLAERRRAFARALRADAVVARGVREHLEAGRT